MKYYIKQIVYLTLVAGLFTACNKEDLNVEKVMQIVVNGYNGGQNALQMRIDTTDYDVTVGYGRYIMKPASIIGTNFVYSYSSDKKRLFTLTDTITKQVLYRKELPASGTKAAFNYIFLEGKELDIPAPTASPATNKLIFYVHYTTSNEPFDIFLYRKDNSTGQEFRAYLAKNVTPGKWVEVDYITAEGFGKTNELSAANVLFTKAGTTNQWAFDDDQGKSTIWASPMNLPKNEETGLTQPYFIIPTANNGGLVRLYFYPDRQ